LWYTMEQIDQNGVKAVRLIERMERSVSMKTKNTSRFLVAFAGALLFSGLLVFSILRVRYDVQGAEKSEFNVIEYTLTDSIKRAEDGGFVVTSLSKEETASGQGEPGKGTPEPCPT
jgi:hypothetical protein